MKLNSSDFEDGGDIPLKFTCQGEGISPTLSWSEIPAGAKSLALSLVDPDAPGGNFIHWLIINIPASASGIGQNETIGDELPNTTGNTNYIPPCPPSGKHRYIFTLYALDVDHLDPQIISDFEAAIKPYILDQAQLIGLYRKQ